MLVILRYKCNCIMNEVALLGIDFLRHGFVMQKRYFVPTEIPTHVPALELSLIHI